jgi:hypothetical protein
VLSLRIEYIQTITVKAHGLLIERVSASLDIDHH